MRDSQDLVPIDDARGCVIWYDESPPPPAQLRDHATRAISEGFRAADRDWSLYVRLEWISPAWRIADAFYSPVKPSPSLRQVQSVSFPVEGPERPARHDVARWLTGAGAPLL